MESLDNPKISNGITVASFLLENYGYKLRSECKFPKAPLDTIKDIQFFDDPISELIEVQPGQFVVFDTCHAHAPTIGFGSIKKLVGKIRKR